MKMPARNRITKTWLCTVDFGYANFIGVVAACILFVSCSLANSQELAPVAELDVERPAQFLGPAVPLPLPEVIQQAEQVPTPAPNPEEIPSASSPPAPEILQQVSAARLLPNQKPVSWSLSEVVGQALLHSNRVAALRLQSLESRQDAAATYVQFDARTFVEQRYQDSDLPVRNLIDVANPNVQTRINGENLSLNSGYRKQLASGGEVELGQRFDWVDDNSGILNPPDQVLSRFGIRLTKNLLNGAGRDIAFAPTLIAEYNARATHDRVVAESAELIAEAANTYWDLFSARSEVLAEMDNVQRASQTIIELESRKSIDAEPNLLALARSTHRNRLASLQQAQLRMKLAQDALVRLINSPALKDRQQCIEIIPCDYPVLREPEFDTCQQLLLGLEQRREILSTLHQMEQTRVELRLAMNQVLPVLDLVLDTSLNGIAGNDNLSNSLDNQFSENPSYQVGFNFELPLGTRPGRFEARKAQLALARQQRELADVIEQIKQEVYAATRTFSTEQSRISLQQEVVQYASAELSYLSVRDRVAPREGSNRSFELTLLLAAQNRLNDARAELGRAVASKEKSKINLQLATGTLVQPICYPTESLDNSTLKSLYRQLVSARQDYRCRVNSVASRINSAAAAPACTCQ